MKPLCAALAAAAALGACGGNGAESSVVDAPAAASTGAGSVFYGVNGHINQGGPYASSSVQTQLAQLQDLGVKIYRNDVFDAAGARRLADAAATMKAGGVVAYPVLLVDPGAYSSESDAYSAGFALGQATAQAMQAPYYEVGNELDSFAIQDGNHDGIDGGEYDNGRFVLARGAIRGLIDGVRSADASGQIVMAGSSWLHFGFDQMLLDGAQPDGSGGHPTASWDITAWHWYSDMGNILNACGGSGCHDVLGSVQQAFGKPIWLSEFGTRPYAFSSDGANARYLTGSQMMEGFQSRANQYNLQSIQDYELYDDPPGGEGNYGLIKNDGSTIKAQYTAYKNFVAAHPQ